MLKLIRAEEDLLTLISDAVPESLVLDYKRIESLGKDSRRRNEISKDVSAFANSAGGRIIYGIMEDKHIPQQLDRGVDPNEISKEWLEQVINSTIQRRIDGVVIHQIWLNATAPGRVAYVVDIPQSTRAPHMASDHKFYKRYNFESIPMEEYEVRDVATRTRGPLLEFHPTLEFHRFDYEGEQKVAFFRLKGCLRTCPSNRQSTCY